MIREALQRLAGMNCTLPPIKRVGQPAETEQARKARERAASARVLPNVLKAHVLDATVGG